MVLEQYRARRTYRHAFRRADPLGYWQGLQGRRDRHRAGAALRSASLRDQLREGGGKRRKIPADAQTYSRLGEEIRQDTRWRLGAHAHRLVEAYRSRTVSQHEGRW